MDQKWFIVAILKIIVEIVLTLLNKGENKYINVLSKISKTHTFKVAV